MASLIGTHNRTNGIKQIPSRAVLSLNGVGLGGDETHADTITVLRDTRVFPDGEAPPDFNSYDGSNWVAYGEYWYNLHKAQWVLNPADYYQITNEQGGGEGPDVAANLQRLIDVESSIMQAANADGRKICLLNLAGGSPGDFELWKELIAPFLVRAWDYGGNIYGRHCYADKFVNDDGSIVPGQPQRVIDELEYLKSIGYGGGMVLTECGLYGGYGVASYDYFEQQVTRWEQALRPYADIFIGLCWWETGASEFNADYTAHIKQLLPYIQAAILPRWTPPEQPEEPPMKHKAICVKLPQDMTAAEWLKAADTVYPLLHTMTASHDDMLTILNGGNAESFVKFSHPERDLAAVGLVESAGYRWERLYSDTPTPPLQINLVYRPCQTTTVTQSFGANPDAYDDFGLPGHDGTDYAVGKDLPFYAAADGTVVHASDRKWSNNTASGYGWHVVLNHGDYCTVYAHARPDLPVTVGQSVTAGQVVGYSGNTGNSTGYHLHFGLLDKTGTIDPGNGYPVWFYGRPVNPAPFLSGKPAPVTPPPPAPAPTIDVAPYFVPSGQYGHKLVMKVGEGTQPMQLEKRANDVILRKGDGNWIDGKRYQDSEQWRVKDGQVQKGIDTSDAGNGGRDGYDLGWAQWIPQFVQVGKTYHSTPTVKRFNRTLNCQVFSEIKASDFLHIKALVPTWVSPANPNIVLNNVLIVEWRSGTADLNVAPNETYYFCKEFGYVGWGSHFILEITQGQSPLAGALDCGM